MGYIQSKFRYYFRTLYHRWNYDTQKSLVLLGKLHAEAVKNKTALQNWSEVEFQVFSQRGEDGIIQYIIHKIDIPNKIFIEFGVEDYTESNTRFLLMNNNWSGLVIDGSKENVRFIKSDFIYWKYDLTALLSFITRDNINALISGFTTIDDIGLLSIDVDGNDYWIWEAITAVNPRIVVCEYNASFGNGKKVTVPYDADFIRRKAHYSDLYFGASLPALVSLADRKGYRFIGVASTGVNAFFVRKDIASVFLSRDAATDFVASPNRDSRDPKGRLSFLPHNKRLVQMMDMPLYDIDRGEVRLVKEIYGL